MGDEEDEEYVVSVAGEKALLGCAWMKAPARLEDVHTERERCFANLAAASLQTFAFDSALKYCKRALTLNPRNAKVYFRKGRAEMELGEMAAAMTSFSEALRLAPKDVEVAKALQLARVACLEEKTESRAVQREFVHKSAEPADSATHMGGYAKQNVAAALWDRAAMENGRVSDESKEKLSEEDAASQIEYNKRQLLHHCEQSKQKEAE